MDFQETSNTLLVCFLVADLSSLPGTRIQGGVHQLKRLREQYDRKVQYQRKVQVPIWNGEFGPICRQGSCALSSASPRLASLRSTRLLAMEMIGGRQIYNATICSKISSPSMITREYLGPSGCTRISDYKAWCKNLQFRNFSGCFHLRL